MAEEIFIADKKTLDEVNKNSNAIKQDTDFIKQQFLLKISGGTDWSKYTILNKRINLKRISTKKYISCFAIHGKGFFNECYAGYYNNSDYSFLKIVVDDDIILESTKANAENTEVGFINFNNNVTIDSNVKFSMKDDINNCKLLQPIFFNKNIEVFVKNNDNSYARIFDYLYFRGGFIK